jgi:DNA-binding CsgD family transcriptional regulator
MGGIRWRTGGPWRHGHGGRVLVVGSYRGVELSRQHPLSNTLGELARHPRFDRLRLRGLSREDVGSFLEGVLGRPPAAELVAALHSQTEGNLLFLTEIVRFLVQEGVLTPERGSLHTPSGQSAGTSVRVRIPEGIREVIGQRLNRLSQGCNHLLSIASVIGREFSLEEVSAVLDAEAEEHVVERLEEAVGARVIEEPPQARGRYQFTHALIRETLYDELTTARRVRLHRRIGEALEHLYAAHLDPHLGQLAHHFAEAAQGGGADKAVAYAVRAGGRSMALLAYEEAVRFYRMALDELELGDPMDAAERCRLQLALGAAQSKAGEFPQARETLLRAAGVARADLPRDGLWVTCITYLSEVCAFLGDADRAATLYRLLLPYAQHNIVAGGGVACYGAGSRYLGLLAATMGQWVEADRHFEAALALNARMGARPWLAHTRYDFATMLLARGQPGDRERAVALLDEALASARALGMYSLQGHIAACMQPLETRTQTVQAYHGDLSPREAEVLRLLAVGKSNRDIADTLCISLSTVATHVRSILRKTGAANRTEAAAYALRQGLAEG